MLYGRFRFKLTWTDCCNLHGTAEGTLNSDEKF